MALEVRSVPQEPPGECKASPNEKDQPLWVGLVELVEAVGIEPES